MKECEKCKYLRRCSDKLVCGSNSSDNYDQYIEKIDRCDVFGFNWPPHPEENCEAAEASGGNDMSFQKTVGIPPLQFEFRLKDDPVNHPDHYNSHQHECIDEMLAVFGKEAVINFCICNAWKYRYRADSKGSHDQDMEKADWYINKAMELKNEKNYDWVEERR